MKKDKPSYRDLFFLQLKEEMSNGTLAHMYLTLFGLMDKPYLEKELAYLHRLSEGKDDYFKKEGKEAWFAIWHKSVRQVDYFSSSTDGSFVKKERLQLLSDKEDEELKYLRKLYRVDRKSKEEGKAEGKLFSDEYSRYLDLAERKRREVEEASISGHLDALLWDAVYIDNDRILYNAFLDTFRKYDRLSKKKEKV